MRRHVHAVLLTLSGTLSIQRLANLGASTSLAIVAQIQMTFELEDGWTINAVWCSSGTAHSAKG